MAISWVKNNRGKATAIGVAIVGVVVALMAGDDVAQVISNLMASVFPAPVPTP